MLLKNISNQHASFKPNIIFVILGGRMSDSKRQREEEITPEPKKQRTSVVAEQALKCDSAPPLETRYGRVKDSRKIKVRTNLFETNIALDRKYYQFHVDFVVIILLHFH